MDLATIESILLILLVLDAIALTVLILMQQGRWLGEATARRKDGSYFPQEVSLCALEDNKLICICRDISERKRAEDAILQKSQDLELHVG